MAANDSAEAHRDALGVVAYLLQGPPEIACVDHHAAIEALKDFPFLPLVLLISEILAHLCRRLSTCKKKQEKKEVCGNVFQTSRVVPVIAARHTKI